MTDAHLVVSADELNNFLLNLKQQIGGQSEDEKSWHRGVGFKSQETPKILMNLEEKFGRVFFFEKICNKVAAIQYF